MITGVSCFSVMAAFVKAADQIPAGETMFFRSICALPIIVIWLMSRGSLRSGLKTKSWQNHAVRGIAGSCAMILGFMGLKLLPLPEVTALRFATPILIVVLAALILGERLRIIRISAVLVGLIGVLIVIWPRLTFDASTAAQLGVAVTLASAGLAALAQIFIKSMSKVENTTAIVFYFSLTSSTVALFTIPFGWVMPMGIEWVYLIGAGLLGGAGQLFMTASYRFADASVLAPFTYVSMLWALAIGLVFFGEVPTLPMLAGAALVIAAGVVIVLRERQLGIRATAERKITVKSQG